MPTAGFSGNRASWPRGFHIDANDTCLDVGCGDGGMSLFAAAMGAAVIASDIDPARIATVRAALDRSRARDVTTIVSDSSPLPLADSTATRIICTEVLEHVEDPAAVLAELVRVGKPGAVYLLTVPDETAELVQKQLAPPAYWRSPNHLRVFSRQAFGDLVSASGLHVQHRCYTGFFWAVWWLLFWAADQEFGEPEVPLLASWSRTWHHLMKARDVAFGKALEGFVRDAAKTVMGNADYDTLSGLTKSLKHSLQRRQSRKAFDLPYPKVESLELTGVVYTTIFNTDDGRKNWNDLVTGYLCALADRDDATLVVKLIARKPQSVKKVIDYYLERGIKHRCKLAFICDFLTNEQMLELCQGTTFYLQSTKAEGNCLPLMNYLAAGRPGISPDHSSMSDYFSDRSGFVVESHPEPTTWPHERWPRSTRPPD
jgi:SAM-dependent methyltransferase